MSAAHTPGPWADYGRVGNGIWIKSKNGQQVCVVYGLAVNPEAHPNAHLIALAPDHALVARLLSAKLMSWAPFSYSEDRGELVFNGLRHATQLDDFGIPILTDHLRGLIAKAEGRV